jgi:hypothetical protein|tara:strand:- start:227 stop:364 length:138 start_codon:yes stop_codon:yes gene_type:complete
MVVNVQPFTKNKIKKLTGQNVLCAVSNKGEELALPTIGGTVSLRD